MDPQKRAGNLALIHLIRREADSGFAKPDTDHNNRTEKHTTKQRRMVFRGLLLMLATRYKFLNTKIRNGCQSPDNLIAKNKHGHVLDLFGRPYIYCRTFIFRYILCMVYTPPPPPALWPGGRILKGQ
jgi:hypothetical protein